MQIVWTALALRDLAAARAYIAIDNPIAANEQVLRVTATVAKLLQFPHVGRQGRRPATRELVVARTPYVVTYRLQGDRIEILRVLHGRQRWPEEV